MIVLRKNQCCIFVGVDLTFSRHLGQAHAINHGLKSLPEEKIEVTL